MIQNKEYRNEMHWRQEDYVQRCITQVWKMILLRNEDTLVFNGNVRKLKAKNLGGGVYEIYKEKLK